MSEIHCHGCGGFISDPANISYQLKPHGSHTAIPKTSLCGCSPSVVFGAPPGYINHGTAQFMSRN